MAETNTPNGGAPRTDLPEGFRTFTVRRGDRSKLTLTVRVPTREETRMAEAQQGRVYNEMLELGMPIKARLIRRMRENGSWDETNERELEDARLEAVAADRGAKEARRLAQATPADAALAEAAAEAETALNAARARYGRFVQELEAMFIHTADARADEARRNYLVACVVTEAVEAGEGFAEGERYFNSITEVEYPEDPEVAERCKFEFMLTDNGIHESPWQDANPAAEDEDEDDAETDTETDTEPREAEVADQKPLPNVAPVSLRGDPQDEDEIDHFTAGGSAPDPAPDPEPASAVS